MQETNAQHMTYEHLPQRTTNIQNKNKGSLQQQIRKSSDSSADGLSQQFSEPMTSPESCFEYFGKSFKISTENLNNFIQLIGFIIFVTIKVENAPTSCPIFFRSLESLHFGEKRKKVCGLNWVTIANA
ncbi:hypothetical protein ACKWTF_008181 [Chironomus riparius]